LNGDQRLNRFGATQFTAELGSNSDLTRVQSWTTLVQRALSYIYQLEADILCMLHSQKQILPELVDFAQI